MQGIVDRGVRGLGAGLLATGVEALLTRTQNRLRGAEAVYDPAQLARRLAKQHLGIRLSPRSARRAGRVMRWSYGPGWALALAAAMGTRRGAQSWPLWGLGLGAAVFTFEVILLPATGATPPLSSWRRDELGLDLLNTMAFGAATAAFLHMVPSRGTVTS